MTVEVRPIRLEEYLEPACKLLEEAWQPPCVQYSPEHVSWQINFPSRLPALAVAAFAEQDMEGLAAAFPCRLRLGEKSADVLVVSFVSVRPAWCGQGIAAALYDALLQQVRSLDCCVLTFAEADSAGEKCLRRAYPRNGFQLRLLGDYPVYGHVVRPGALDNAGVVIEEIDAARFAREIERFRDKKTLWNDPDEAQLQHYLRDSRPRSLIQVRRPDGQSLGAAMILRAALRTAQGTEWAPALENLYLSESDADALRALCQLARRRYGVAGQSGVVLAANVWEVAPATLRAAGLRQTRAAWRGYLAATDTQHPFLSACGTNYEVV